MKTRLFAHEGRDYTLAELAEKYGIKTSTLSDRLRKRGITIDEALAMGPGIRCKLHCYHGQMLAIPEIARLSGKAEQTIRHRMHRGWTIEEAADLPRGANKAEPNRTTCEVMPIVLDGLMPEEIARWSAAVNIFRSIGTTPAEWNFRCIVPMKEYAFESDLLAWTIRFSPDGRRAELTAFYKEKEFESDFRRVYKVSGDEIQEVIQK